jgi:predicted metal-dependent phosphotriesterase family hydrolase
MTIESVLGPIEPAVLGFTLPHEHVFANLTREYRGEGLLHDEDLMTQELEKYKAAGGSSLVDCTSIGLGRDPLRLREIARRSGVTIIMGAGFYRDPYIEPAWLDRRTVDEISEQITTDLEDGVDGTGVKAGLIGEIGADKWYVSALEERSFRAAARAQKRTGVAITTHAARWSVGLAQLDILAHEGVDLRRVVIGHCDTVPDMDYHVAVADRGAYVQFDTIGLFLSEYDQDRRVAFIRNLVDRGHADRILISHDICLRTALSATGGPGFSHILDHFLDRLRAAHVAEEHIHQITVENVARALAPG